MIMRARHRGFTLVELLVAISITVLMLFLVGRIFFDTTEAVSAGISTGQVIDHSRTINDQLVRDAEAMMSPNATTPGNAGFLMILTKTYNGVQYDAGKSGTAPRTSNEAFSDQLVFIINSTSLRPVTPGADTTYSNGAAADRARVFYGHGLRVNSDGTDAGTLASSIGNQWILCRQATLLSNAPSTVFAANATENAAITGYPPLPVGITAAAWEGLSDVASQNLAALVGTLVPATYPADALPYAYGTQRLRVNPTPETGPSPDYYESWRVAQGHSHLMSCVSDFSVEFEADANKDLSIDTDVNGNIVWYSGRNPPTTPPYDFSTYTVGSPYVAAPGVANADAAFIWRHTDDHIGLANDVLNSTWPYLIRIRYRLHDPRGLYGLQFHLDGSGNPLIDEHGRWFEQIIKVNRP